MIATSEISIQKQDKWNRLCFILRHIQTYSQHLFDEKLNIWGGERENDLHFANKAVYFRRFA